MNAVSKVNQPLTATYKKWSYLSCSILDRSSRREDHIRRRGWPATLPAPHRPGLGGHQGTLQHRDQSGPSAACLQEL